MEEKVFLPIQDCIINDYFIDANHPIDCRLEYCERNCRYSCLNGEDYKKRRVINSESR